MIELRGVGLRRGKQRIFENLDLAIPDPGLYGVVGAVGSGKSVFARMLCGLCRPTTGSVRIDHQSQYGLLPHRSTVSWYSDAAQLDPTDESVENYVRTMVYDSGADQRPVTQFLSRLEVVLGAPRFGPMSNLSSGQVCLLQLALSGVMAARLVCFDGHADSLDRAALNSALDLYGELRTNQDAFILLTSRHGLEGVDGISGTLSVTGNLPASIGWSAKGGEVEEAVPLRLATRLRLRLAGHESDEPVPSGQTYKVLNVDGQTVTLERRGEFSAMLAELESAGLVIKGLAQD